MSTLSRNALGQYKANPDLLHLALNQDSSCISIGTRKGYSIHNVEPFGRVYSKGDGSVQVVEMLFTTSLIALVYTTAPRKLQIVNTKRASIICELTFPTSILAVKLNRRRLVAVLEEQIYIYDIANMKLLHTIETSPNPNAICALSPSSENAYLAYPSPLAAPSEFPAAAPVSAASTASKGDVLLFDSLSLSVTNIVQAHRAPLSALTLSQNGSMLATSSDKGTVIRVFNVPNGERVAEFRRGSYPARIFHLAFNAVSTLLGATSDTDTVHIFKLPVNDKQMPASLISRRSMSPSESSQTSSADGGGGNGGGGYEAFIDTKRQQQQNSAATSIRKKSLLFGRSVAASVGGGLNGLGLVPKAVSGLWDPQRDFAFLKVPISGVRSCVGFSGTTPEVSLLTSEGVLHLYSHRSRGWWRVCLEAILLIDGRHRGSRLRRVESEGSPSAPNQAIQRPLV